LTEQNSVNVEIFDVSGKKLGSIANGIFKPGSYNIPLILNNISTQMYLVRLKIGSIEKCLKLCMVRNDRIAQKGPAGPLSTSFAKKLSFPIDTIVVVHNRFTSQMLPIIDSISSIIIMLVKKPSTPHVWAIGDLGQLKDTIISQRDSLLVGIGAKDSIGNIKRYYWDIGGNGWIDSTSKSDSALKYVKYPSGGYIPIIVGARNDAGFLGTDTFHILFNRPPTSCGLKTNYNTDKGGWSDFNYSTGKGSIQVSFAGEDPDFPRDSLKYDMYWGVDSNSLSKKYSGENATALISELSIQTQFYWKVVARDLFGESVFQIGIYTSSGTPPAGIFWNLITDAATYPGQYLQSSSQFSACTYDNKMWIFMNGLFGPYGNKQLVYINRK
jgi:hypothetical protein